MAERIDVMISSTARDLPDYRQQAMDACVRQGMFPIMMEHLPAMDANAISASLDMVDEAEIYLGIVARRYGYVPEGHSISITEMEYNRAVERGIPRLIFIMKDDYEYPSSKEPPEIIEELARFKERLQTDQVVNYFGSPSDLRAQIINSLSRFHNRSVTAFHRVTSIPTAPEPYVAHPYTLLETEELFGRKAELKLLTNWLVSAESELTTVRVMSIVAIGGMGKSALTWKWFNDVAPDVMKFAGRMWWSFYESDARYENFITRALAYVSGQNEETVQTLPLNQREDDLLAILDQEPFLVTLDGLERLLVAYAQPRALLRDALDMHTTGLRGNTEQILQAAHFLRNQSRLRKATDPRAGNFLRRLTGIKASRVLISTRLYPDTLETSTGSERPGAKALALTGLDDDDAFNLWTSLGVRGPRDELVELFRSFDNYPLLIRALAGEVARYRRAPGDFRRWRKANEGFNPFEMPMIQRQSHVLQFALAGLTEPQLKILQTIAAFSVPASYDTLTDLLVGGQSANEKDFRPPLTSENELDSELADLEDRGLLGWDRSANRYDLHPVVRGVIWRGLEPGSKHEIYQRLRVHLEAIPPVENWRDVQHMEDLTSSIELYRTLIGLERYDEAFDVLSSRLYKPLRYRLSTGQHLAALLEGLFPDGVDSSPRLSRPADQAWALNALARAYQMIGQPGRAAPRYKHSNALKESANYTVDLSSGLRDLAYAQRLCGNLHESEAAARRAVLLDREEENQLLEAISLQVFGLALAARGNKQRSAQALEVSLELANRTDANRAYNHQAMRSLWFGDYESAKDWAEKGRRYCKQRGLEAGLILAMRLQGQASLGLGNIRPALNYLNKALAHARSVILVEEEIASLIALAELQLKRGELETAMEHLDEVWDTVEQAPYRLFHADASNILAAIHVENGDLQAAGEAATRAYLSAWCDGPPYTYHHGLKQAKKLLRKTDTSPPELPPFDSSQHESMPRLRL